MKRFIAMAVLFSMLFILMPTNVLPITIYDSSNQEEDIPEGDDHPWGGDQMDVGTGTESYQVDKNQRYTYFSMAYPAVSISIIIAEYFYKDTLYKVEAKQDKLIKERRSNFRRVRYSTSTKQR